MKEFPLVSVIVLSYNNLEHINDAMNSILIQDYPNIELIINDDGSFNYKRDVYYDYIQENQSGNIKRLIVNQNENNLGTVKNANKAISMARGEYLKLLGADDALYNNRVLSEVVNYFKTRKCLLLTSKVEKCDLKLIGTGQVINNKFQENLNTLTNKDCYIRLCRRNSLLAAGVFFSLSFFEKYGLFDEDYKLLEDWPTWLRITRQGCIISYLNIISVKYRSGGGVSSGTNRVYLEDRKTCFKKEILAHKNLLGRYNFFCSSLSFYIRNSIIIKCIHSYIRKHIGLLTSVDKE